ncbi:MAG: transposase [Ktedonobacterales bacterium]
MSTTRRAYPTDVSDDKWAFVAPHLILLPADISQRKHVQHEGINGLRSQVKTGVHWRMLPHDVLARRATLAGGPSPHVALDGG